MTFAVPHWMKQASGYTCNRPYEYEFESEARLRDCGRCPRCTARKKRDVAGRCAAEAYTSAEVVAWTLTYRPGEAGAVDFVTEDRQRFLKRVRDWLYRQARAEVGAPKRYRGASDHVRLYYKARIAEVLPVLRFMGCGERGKRSTKRCHFHLVLFMSRKSGFVSTPRQADGKPGREDHPLWPHGFVNVHVLGHDIETKMRAVRYAVKYLDKSRLPSKAARRRGEKPEARFFRSLASPLGYAFLCDLARDHAQQGLPVHGDYRVPGVRFSRGRGAGFGDHVRHVLSGRMRDHYIAAYREEWERLRPDIDVPMTDFLMLFDPDACMRGSPQARYRAQEWRKALKGLEPMPPIPVVPKRDRSGVLAVDVPGKGNVGMVRLRFSGFAEWIAADGTVYPVPHGNIRDYVPLDESCHARVEQWIRDRRGPDWVSPRDLRVMRAERQLARREAIERWAKRAPGCLPEFVADRLQPMTALRRKLWLNGDGHMPGTVVYDPLGKPDDDGRKPGFIRPVTGLRKPVHKRLC